MILKNKYNKNIIKILINKTSFEKFLIKIDTRLTSIFWHESKSFTISIFSLSIAVCKGDK